MSNSSCFCVMFALAMLLGCNLDDSTQWLHPRRCAIKNDTKRKMETVVLRLVVEKWEIVPTSLLPGETKVVALPGGKIPDSVILGWDHSSQGSTRAHMSLEFIDSDGLVELFYLLCKQRIFVVSLAQ